METNPISDPIMKQLDSTIQKWVAENYPYYLIEGLNDEQRSFIRHPSNFGDIKNENSLLFLMVASLHFGGNWYFWVKENQNNPKALKLLIQLLNISYDRVKFRILLSLQLLDSEETKTVVESLKDEIPSNYYKIVKEYVLDKRVKLYLEKIARDPKSGLANKVAVVIREYNQYGEAESGIKGESSKRVFISYNHRDARYAKLIKTALQNANIDLTIDIDNLKFGDNIERFIKQSVSETDYTISIVSKSSLLSPWVFLESFETILHEQVNKTKKYIPVIVDKSILDPKFQNEAIKHIETGILDLVKESSERSAQLHSTLSFDNKKNRLIELRNNLDKILDKLNQVKYVDFSSDQATEENLPFLIQLIVEEF